MQNKTRTQSLLCIRAVISGEDLVSSWCIKERGAPSQAPLRASSCLSIFLCHWVRFWCKILAMTCVQKEMIKYLCENFLLFLYGLQLKSTQYATFDVCYVQRLGDMWPYDREAAVVFRKQQAVCLNILLEALLVCRGLKVGLITRCSLQ